MTIRELCKLIPHDSNVKLALNGNNFDFAHTDSFQLDAFGDYEIETVFAIEEDAFEIKVAMQPIRHSK